MLRSRLLLTSFTSGTMRTGTVLAKVEEAMSPQSRGYFYQVELGMAEIQRVWVKRIQAVVEEIAGEKGARASPWMTRGPRVLGFLDNCST